IFLCLVCLVLCTLIFLFCKLQQRRPNFNFQKPPPRHRFELQGSGGGRNRGNYHVNLGARGEYDIHRFKNGGKVVGYGQGSQSFGRFDGQSYKGKPQGEVGVRVEIPIGKGK
ncbi:secreted salivary gland peptide, putative, partial [Ixodes scapularis]